jgi:hypothetical protein
MNDILCQKCNAKQSKINMEFSTFYKCQICENTCCINCMYVVVYVIKKLYVFGAEQILNTLIILV